MTSVYMGKEPIEGLTLEELNSLCQIKYKDCDVRFGTFEFDFGWGYTRKACALFYRRSK